MQNVALVDWKLKKLEKKWPKYSVYINANYNLETDDDGNKYTKNAVCETGIFNGVFCFDMV